MAGMGEHRGFAFIKFSSKSERQRSAAWCTAPACTGGGWCWSGPRQWRASRSWGTRPSATWATGPASTRQPASGPGKAWTRKVNDILLKRKFFYGQINFIDLHSAYVSCHVPSDVIDAFMPNVIRYGGQMWNNDKLDRSSVSSPMDLTPVSTTPLSRTAKRRVSLATPPLVKCPTWVWWLRRPMSMEVTTRPSRLHPHWYWQCW